MHLPDLELRYTRAVAPMKVCVLRPVREQRSPEEAAETSAAADATSSTLQP